MSEPFLNLRDVGFMVESVGGGRGTQGVSVDLETEGERVAAHEFVHAVGRDRVVQLTGAVVTDRAEEGAFGVGGVAGFIENHGVALDAQVSMSFSLTIEIALVRTDTMLVAAQTFTRGG
jgi:hypothetical protein